MGVRLNAVSGRLEACTQTQPLLNQLLLTLLPIDCLSTIQTFSAGVTVRHITTTHATNTSPTASLGLVLLVLL
jgi:hypothetical protein